jgi:hypothetical protein
VTGQLQYSFNNKLPFVLEFGNMYPELSKKLKLNHVIHTLTFGDTASQAAIKRRFGSNSEHTQFDMMDFVDDELYINSNNGQQTESKDYFYFLKLVPHVFIDEIH